MGWQAWEKGGNEPPQVKDGQALCSTYIDNVIRFENSLQPHLLLDRIGAKPMMRPKEKNCVRISTSYSNLDHLRKSRKQDRQPTLFTLLTPTSRLQ